MGSTRGFTLIEVLVALAISSILITGVYTVMRQGTGQLAIVEEHQQELNNLFLIRRVLDRDLQSLVPFVDPQTRQKYRFRVTTEGVVLNCKGSVVRESRLGALVEVHYRMGSGPDAVLERRVVAVGGDVALSDEVLRLGQLANPALPEIYDGEEWGEWSLADTVSEEKMRGVRFKLNYQRIGEWSLLYPIAPLTSGEGAV